MFRRREFLGAAAGAGASSTSVRGKPAASTSPATLSHFFPGFRRTRVKTTGAEINVLIGGKGPPLLLLHGYPQTHIMWRKVAPELAKTHTIIATDLRGYGDSSKPASDPVHAAYSKRSMALDQVQVMDSLGFQKFAILAHDRGARVAHRLMLDHPDRVTRAILIDICPTSYMYKTADRVFASAYFHWFFLIQDAPLPERMIANNVETWLGWSFDAAARAYIGPEAYAEYLRCFADPATIRASCEDYRAAASVDLEHDQADENRKVACPLRVLWGSEGLIGHRYDVLGVWRGFADNVSGRTINSGHWVAEEAPVGVIAEAQRFFV
jgi:haloacetate dehalogenase